MADAATTRAMLEPRLVELVCGLRHEQVKEAMGLLLDYIDAQAAPVPAPVIGDSEAMALFKKFVRDNAMALRLVAHWGDGECGALHEVLLNELQGKSLFDGAVSGFADDGGAPDGRSCAGKDAPAAPARGRDAPLFPEDGGVEP